MRGAADLTAPPVRRPTRLEAVRTPSLRPRSALVLEAFFTALLVLVAVGITAFAGLTWKKLYQGQR